VAKLDLKSLNLNYLKFSRKVKEAILKTLLEGSKPAVFIERKIYGNRSK
jgi:hypothetical protein